MSNQSNDIPEGFKITDLGLLPEEWEVIPFTESLGKRTGNVPDSIKRGEYKPTGKYPIVDQSEKYIAGYTDDAEKIYSSDFPIIIFGDHTRIFKFVDFPFAIGADGTKILNPNSGLFDPKYFYYCLTSLDIPSRGYNRHFKILKEKTVIKPPLPEQKAIARVLSIIQNAVEAQDKIIAAARELKKSLMRHLFTYGPVPMAEAEHVQLKETEVGSVPEQWEVVRLGNVTYKPEYGYTATASSETIGPKFLRITDIQNGMVDWLSVPYCQCPATEIEKYRLLSGDTLFARIGATTGKTYLVEDCPLAIFASYLIRVRCKSSLLPAYLSQFTTTQNYWDQVNASKGGRLKQGVNTPVLKSLLLPFPSLPEQQEIARMLSVIDKKIKSEAKRKISLQTLFKTMLNQLMAGKVRVKDLEDTAA